MRSLGAETHRQRLQKPELAQTPTAPYLAHQTIPQSLGFGDHAILEQRSKTEI